MKTVVVEVLRGDLVESEHRVHAVVAHAERGVAWSAGDADRLAFVRSSIKMFQALPLVESGGVERFGFTTEELALCTASHGGEVFHVEGVRSMLAKIKVTEDALACGPQAPMHGPSAEALRASGIAPSRVHNNCSGKHAGMLAFTIQQGWVTNGYHRASHPTQRRVRETLGRWTGVSPDAIASAVDGCGLPTFALPLSSVAQACARFAAAAADLQPAPSTIVSAMTTKPQFVAGTNRLCTDLMRETGGRLFAKVGAEGYYCAGVPSMRLGVALKVEDGGWRAAEPALLAVLAHVEAITSQESLALTSYAHPRIRNTRGEVVGGIRVRGLEERAG